MKIKNLSIHNLRCFVPTDPLPALYTYPSPVLSPPPLSSALLWKGGQQARTPGA